MLNNRPLPWGKTATNLGSELSQKCDSARVRRAKFIEKRQEFVKCFTLRGRCHSVLHWVNLWQCFARLQQFTNLEIRGDWASRRKLRSSAGWKSGHNHIKHEGQVRIILLPSRGRSPRDGSKIILTCPTCLMWLCILWCIWSVGKKSRSEKLP